MAETTARARRLSMREVLARPFVALAGAVADVFRCFGAVTIACFCVPLLLGGLLLARLAFCANLWRVIKQELSSAGSSIAKLVLYRPLLLVYMDRAAASVRKSIEAREQLFELPPERAPLPGQEVFPGFVIEGRLPTGGSGARLYIAREEQERGPERVVIKSFRLSEGSTLPEIVRESRALDAAKRMGLVKEYELTHDRMFYTMRFVPGMSLSRVIMGWHSDQPGGLDAATLKRGLLILSDLLRTLVLYHDGGLFHKDVKPDNVIIETLPDGKSVARLVDFGLANSLRSAMTLTTHGTEYFRDPEMVRQAMRGVKVHEIDGTRFDVYAAGAVLFAMVEGSFPAHGSLSRVSKPCPDAVKWIIKRAMAEYEKRYASSREMLEDVEALCASEDVSRFRIGMLPSLRRDLEDDEVDRPLVSGGRDESEPDSAERSASEVQEGAGSSDAVESPTLADLPIKLPPRRDDGLLKIVRNDPLPGDARIDVTDWLTGRFTVVQPGTSVEQVTQSDIAGRVLPVVRGWWAWLWAPKATREGAPGELPGETTDDSKSK